MNVLRIMVDFGLVVLLLAVQLIIYPAFKYYSQENLLNWHPRYTQAITLIVAPLMFFQLGLISLQTFRNFTLLNGFSLALVIFCWISTFAYAVPLHRAIDEGINAASVLDQLLRVNLWRTIAWVGVWLLGLAGLGKII